MRSAISDQRSAKWYRSSGFLLVFIALVLSAMLFLPLSSAQDTGEYVVSTTQDLSGDSQPDLLTAAPDGGTVLSVPGEVVIESGADGALVVIIKGTKANDLFGYSVWSRTDFNGDGHLDLLIGAPNDYSGRVYLFYGPFLESGPLVISASNADAFFGTSDPEVTAFGTQVGAVGDLNCDGIPDFRVGGDIVPALGPPTSRTYIISGATGEFLYQIEEATPFDPWEVLDGDIDGDGLVTLTDFNLVTAKQGLTAPPGSPGTLSVYDGDFNGDGVVDGTDLALTINNLDLVGYQALLPDGSAPGCTNPCPAVIPPGTHCVQDCDGSWIILPININPICGPICLGGGCFITDLNPFFTTFYGSVGEVVTIDPNSSPLDLLINWTLEVLPPSNAVILTGNPANPTSYYLLNSHAVQVLLLAPGPPVIVHAMATYCNGCSADFIISYGSPGDQDGDGISNTCEAQMGTDPNDYFDPPDQTLDTDNDGLSDVDEVCVYGTNHLYYDSDGDGLPDGWEIDHGLDPLSNDENGNGINDNGEDFDGDGLSNHDEYVYGGDPFNPDTDGDGVNDGTEVDQGSNPGDGSDGGIAPDPDDLVTVNLTIGDGSGSHSEHWELRIGYINFKAPGYGEIAGPTPFRFLRGESYLIKVIHLGSNLPTPDLDYTALVEPVDNCAIVDDPNQLLGVHWNRPPVYPSATLFLPEFDLAIDSDNNNVIDDTDDTIEENSPGKVIFTAIGDSDDDGIPDYADGIARWTNPDGADLLYTDSGGQLVPLNLTVGGVQEVVDNGGSATITLTYSESNPADLPATPPSTWRGVTRPSGQLRIWAKDGSSSRDWHEIDASGTPGDFVASGKAYPLDKFTLTGGQINLFVEAINPSASPGDLTIAVSVDVGTALPCLTDTVTLTAAEIEVHDLRHWEPTWDSATETIGLSNSDLMTNPVADSQVGGAITDGASICLVRLKPNVGTVFDPMIRVVKHGQSYSNNPAVLGGFHTTSSIPPLPVIANQTPAVVNCEDFIDTGRIYYIPPDNYLDATNNTGLTLDDGETTVVRFEVVRSSGGNAVLGTRNFILRRPPVVLVHGLNSSPDAWGTDVWNENNLPTRIYKVDYEATNAMGYDDNWHWVAGWIEGIFLAEYREGTTVLPDHLPSRGFDGIKYAATRADVVAHSMGGLITRLYISDVEVTNHAREDREENFWTGNITWVPHSPPWYKINVFRYSQANSPTSGKWHYLRNENYGAGSIHRFVTLGTPFDGSAIAMLGVTKQRGENKVNHFLAKVTREFQPQTIVTGLVIDPETLMDHAIIDLVPGSTMQRLMDNANYPSGVRRVRWHPCIGHAVGLPPADWAVLAGNIFQGVVLPDSLNDMVPTEGDLVVHESSQRNGQPTVGSDFPNTSHSKYALTYDNFNLEGEPTSMLIFNKVKQLLSTYNTQDWTGDLKQ